MPTATTYYKKHKISKGETIAQSLKERFDYGQNPDKTEGGELISSTVTAGSLIGVAEVYDGAAQLYPQSAADVADFKVDASTPVITEVDPASLTWGAEETVTKNVAVTVVNLGSNALTVDNDAIAPFTAVVNGTTVTVTPPAPNTTSDDIVRTMTVSVAGGNSREVTLTQFAAGSGGDTKGIYTSMSQFIPASTSTTDRYYPSNSTIDGQPATGFKLGTSSLAGVFTSEALGASLTGDKKLSFYAVAWTGKAATVYIRVNHKSDICPFFLDQLRDSRQVFRKRLRVMSEMTGRFTIQFYDLLYA